ncbi:MAG: sulfurtransferase [Desulfobacterales bacterium]|nr:sulfurtransferase [Desulfobacterales bacterium]
MKIRNLLATIVAVGLLISPAAGQAIAADTADWMFHDIVDADFVARHVAVPPADDVMIIDARPKRAKYDKGHIPGAVSIPDTEFDKHLDKLPADKTTLVIYYCEGVKCKLSHKSAKKAEALGYTNVKVYADGFPGWMAVDGHYAQVSADWVAEQLAGGEPMLLVDSRPKRPKYDKGHIPGAVSIPDTRFDDFAGLLPADKNLPVVFYCGGLQCKLSHKSAEKALALGYKNVKVFADGYPKWVAMYGKGAESAAMVKAGEEEGSIDIDTFKQIVTERPDSVYLIDVRDPDEYAKGTLKTARNIPVDKLEDQLAGLATDKPIIYICGTGARSGEAYYMTRDLRPEIEEVYYLESEMTINEDGSFTIKAPANS